MQIELESSRNRWTEAALVNVEQAALCGRYRSPMLAPDAASPCFDQAGNQRVVPQQGPPRPIRLGIKKDGQIHPVPVN
jgi:hypothetical protein